MPVPETRGAPSRPVSLAPPRSAWPAVLTGLVVAVVAAVVAVATVTARYADTHVPGPVSRPATPTPAPAVVETPGVIAFRTTDGEGRLALLHRTWAGAGAAEAASSLRVEVEVVCTGGQLGVAPARFSLFDGAGRLYDAHPGAGGADELAVTRLRPGQRIRGVVAFDLPAGSVAAGGVTLVLADEVGAVTALRVPG